MITTVLGERCYLWRAVDQDNQGIDILVQKHKDTRAAARFFKKMLKHQGRTPRRTVTEVTMLPEITSCRRSYTTRTGQMRGSSSGFLSVHGQVHNLFRVGRHLMRARTTTDHKNMAPPQNLWVQEGTCET